MWNYVCFGNGFIYKIFIDIILIEWVNDFIMKCFIEELCKRIIF